MSNKLETQQDQIQSEIKEIGENNFYSFENQLLQFNDNLSSLSMTFLISIRGFKLHLDDLQKRGTKFQESLHEPELYDGKEYYPLNLDQTIELEEIGKVTKLSDICIATFSQSHIVSLISFADVLILHIMKWIFLQKPEILRNSEKSYTAKEIFNFDSLEDFRDELINNELFRFSNLSFAKKIDELEKKHSIDIKKKVKNWKSFIEVSARRNLFVHTNGIVNEQYLRICQESNIDTGDIKIGDRLSAEGSYFNKSTLYVFEVGFIFGQEMWRHFAPAEINAADNNLIKIGFSLLKDEEYRLAEIVFSYGLNLKKWSDDEIRKMILINLAQTYKWQGNEQKCKKVLMLEDWLLTNIIFQLCNKVLIENYTQAYKIMMDIGNNNSIIKKKDYKDWPVFKKIRNEAKFLSTFQKIYNEPLNIVDQDQINETDVLIKSID